MYALDIQANYPTSLQELLSEIKEDYPIFTKPLEAIINYEHNDLLNPDGMEAIIYLIMKSIEDDDTERIYNLLFNPRVASSEEVARFRFWHNIRHFNTAHDLSYELFHNPGYVLLLESGMYGGKSTLAQRLWDTLENYDFEVFVLVPDFMEEGVVTIRGKKSKDGKANHEINAIKVGENNWEDIINQIDEQMSHKFDKTKAVIHIDEYSFMSGDFIEKFVLELQSRGYRIILPGLDTDYLGRELGGFSAANKIKTKAVVCKSYVSGQGEYQIVDNPDPEGRMTVRHIKINNQWIPDIGFAKVVIPKGRSYALYTPGRETDHTQSLLSENMQLLLKILNPSSSVGSLQEQLYLRLEEGYQAKSTPEA